jgi:hypothetical protein
MIILTKRFYQSPLIVQHKNNLEKSSKNQIFKNLLQKIMKKMIVTIATIIITMLSHYSKIRSQFTKKMIVKCKSKKKAKKNMNQIFG